LSSAVRLKIAIRDALSVSTSIRAFSPFRNTLLLSFAERPRGRARRSGIATSARIRTRYSGIGGRFGES
jgi:hypothetical protein